MDANLKVQQFSIDYFQKLSNLYQDFVVGDRSNYLLSIAEGIEQTANLVYEQNCRKRKVIFIGNGGSASVASHQAIDFWRNGGVKAISFNEGAMLTCISNDFGYEQVFSKPIEMFAQPGDVLFAISSSGTSANILAGVKQALEMDCHVVTLSAFNAHNPLRKLGKLNFYVPTMSYGFAEITHLCICHCIIDALIEAGKSSLDEVDSISQNKSQLIMNFQP